MRRVLLSLGALIVGGCAGHSRSSMQQYLESHRSGVCHVHRVRMTTKAMPVEYGYYVLPRELETGRDAQLRRFPFSWRVVRGTILTPESSATQAEWYCSVCEKQRLAWIAAHPADPWSLAQEPAGQVPPASPPILRN